jgi:DNA polymerase-3 subunit epsilon
VCVLDTETTGVDPNRHGMIEVSGIILIEGKAVDRFEIRCRPYPDDEIEPEALEVQGRTLDEIQGWDDPAKMHAALCHTLDGYVDRYDKLDKFGLVAYNAHFDADFLRAWFAKAGDQYFGSWFWNPPMDLMSAAALLVGDARLKMPNFKLISLCNLLKIESAEDRSRPGTDARGGIRSRPHSPDLRAPHGEVVRR